MEDYRKSCITKMSSSEELVTLSGGHFIQLGAMQHFSSFYFTLTDLSRTCVLVTFNTGKDDLELLS